MDSVAQKIETTIESFDREKIFFVEDFIGMGSEDAISQHLSRLTSAGLIIRVTQGVYCYPEVDKKLGLGVIMPSYEQIATAIASRNKARIIPSGDY